MYLEVVLPDSALSDCSDLRQKTIKAGLIARALAVFRVEIITLYDTEPNEKNLHDRSLLEKILRYMDTPQYLRRDVFPITPSLKYAGLLPPMRTRSHPLETRPEAVVDGEYRWGIQKQVGQVDIGLEEPVRCDEQLRTRVPTIFRVSKSENRLTVKSTARDVVGYYFGYDVQVVPNLSEYLASNSSKTRVVLSRQGIPFQKAEAEMGSVLQSTRSLVAIFGSPQSGVRELVQEKDVLKRNVDFWINTIPDQGTETVRLEEAILVSLGHLTSSFGPLIAKAGYYK